MTSTPAQRIRPGWGVGRSLLSVWIVLTSSALITGAGGRRYFVIVGVLSIAVVAGLVLRVALDRARHGWIPIVPRTNRGRFQIRGAKADPRDAPAPLSRLREHDAAVADQVQVALDLLRGQLVPLLGREETSRARTAIESALAEYESIDRSTERTVAARATLIATLRRSDIDPTSDGEALQLGGREADLRQQQAETVARLRHAAAGLQRAWEPVRDQQIVQLRHGELSRARDDAEAVTGQGLPTADASAGLTDAIDEIQATLGGIREVGGINERVLGQDNLPVQPVPGAADDRETR